MNGHPHFDEDFDLYALGTLEGEEERALESHLTGCPACAHKLEEARGRAARVALAVAPEPPSPEVWERLLRQVRATPLRPQARPVAATNPWRWATVALALASMVLAVLLGRQTVELSDLGRALQTLEAARQAEQAETARARAVLEVLTAPDTVKVTLVSGAVRAVPQGKAFYHSEKGLVFYAANLPPLAAGRSYQLWLIPAQGNPISAGVFQPDAQGNGAVLLPPLPAGVPAKAFAVTVEPAGGVPQPTGPKVLIGLVS
ncbi:MAG: hypothetical protein DMG22_14200 [Acidobacteria bacterium]|nr:MAG: hypothetical protein DMG22_14200 [Acidobacteriota bacterium]